MKKKHKGSIAFVIVGILLIIGALSMFSPNTITGMSTSDEPCAYILTSDGQLVCTAEEAKEIEAGITSITRDESDQWEDEEDYDEDFLEDDEWDDYWNDYFDYEDDDDYDVDDLTFFDDDADDSYDDSIDYYQEEESSGSYIEINGERWDQVGNQWVNQETGKVLDENFEPVEDALDYNDLIRYKMEQEGTWDYDYDWSDYEEEDKEEDIIPGWDDYAP